nr:MAG TPA: hypothetical protein [Caudoviricetes sp.]
MTTSRDRLGRLSHQVNLSHPKKPYSTRALTICDGQDKKINIREKQ